MANAPQVTHVTLTPYMYAAVTISWATIKKATSYQTQFRLAGVSSWTNGPVVKAPINYVNMTGLTPGRTYQFQIYAVGE